MLNKLKSFLSTFGIWILIIAFGTLYAAWSINRHNHFLTDAIDLGIFDQPIWFYSRFQTPLSTVKYNTFPGAHILGDHFHPILALLAPLYWIWDDVRVLLLAQAILVVLSAYPIFKLAQLKLQNIYFSFALVFAYLGFIGVQTAVDWDFHETTISILPLAWAFYFLASENFRAYWVTFFLGLLFKEDMPLIFGAIGLFTFVKLRQRWIGFWTMFLSVFYYYFVTQTAIPYFKGDSFAYEHFDPRLGKTTIDFIKTTLTQPWVTAAVLFTPVLKLKTIINYFASFGMLPLLSPLASLAVLPNFATRFLTTLPQRWLIRYQYSVNLAPILAAATIYGLENVRRVWEKYKLRQKIKFSWMLVGAAFFIVVTTLVQTARTRTPLFRMINPRYYRHEARFDLNNKLLAMIPPDASVMAQSAFVPHLSHRQEIYRYEDSLFDKTLPDYMLMSADEHSDPPWPREEILGKIEALRLRPEYEELYWDGVRLLMKKR